MHDLQGCGIVGQKHQVGHSRPMQPQQDGGVVVQRRLLLHGHAFQHCQLDFNVGMALVAVHNSMY